MRKHDIRAIALAIGFAFSAGAMAQSMTKEKCDAFSGDAKGSCLNEAKARFGKT